ncbi:MAG: transporter associated domain-containing protein, partial [Bacteroidota bacterium]
VEEVFGEIEDEHDQEKDEVVEPDMVKVEHEDGTYTLGARLEIDDLNEEFKLDLTEDDYYTTLGGLILYVAEDIPEEGQSITLKNYEVMVLEAMQNRIIKVKLSPKTEVEEGE